MRDSFTAHCGPINLDNNEINDEYDAFKLFFDNEIYETIIKYTLEKN
jgi:hypothetical protein